MRKHLAAAAVLVVSCGLLLSCITEYIGDDLVKPPIVLQLTVSNNTDTPINVQIRHRYKKGWPNEVGDISYSDWIGYDIPAGGSRMLGDETVLHGEDGEETEWSGFMLLDDELNRYFGLTDGHSSFELKVTAGNTIIQLAGYESEAPCFAETQLCDFWLEIGMGPVLRGLVLFHKQSGHDFGLREPTLLTALLDIHADGTYTFDMEPPEKIPEYDSLDSVEAWEYGQAPVGKDAAAFIGDGVCHGNSP
jgi:hypothetical protein